MLTARICIMVFDFYANMRPERHFYGCAQYCCNETDETLWRHGCSVTCGNLFIPPDVVVRLVKERCSLVGAIRQKCRELPQASKAKQ